MLSARQLRTLFSEIIQNFSIVSSPDFGLIYIKHLNNIDLSEIDEVYNSTFDVCVKNGIPTYDEKVKYLIENNLWDKKDEEKLSDYKKLSIQYENNKSTEYLKSKREMWANQLEPLLKDIRILEGKKNLLIKDTAEGFANRKSNELNILKSFYKDKELKNPLFEETDFNDLKEVNIGKIYDLFNEYIKNFNGENLKRVSLSGFFQNMLSLSGDSIFELYGKAAIYLSFYQIDTALYGRYFRSVMAEMGDKIPANIKNDPDKILEYVELNRNYKKMFPNEKEQESQTLVGATKDDLAILNMQPQANTNLNKKLTEKGRLSIEDFENL